MLHGFSKFMLGSCSFVADSATMSDVHLVPAAQDDSWGKDDNKSWDKNEKCRPQSMGIRSAVDRGSLCLYTTTIDLQDSG